jgi:hypothetical protein
MHTTKKKRRRITEKKEKTRYSDKFLVTPAIAPPRQHQKSNIFKSVAPKKLAAQKGHHRRIIDLRFSPEDYLSYNPFVIRKNLSYNPLATR